MRPLPLALALVATAAAAQPPPPNAMLVADVGQVMRLDADGSRRTYVTCEVDETLRVLVPPYNEVRTVAPCRFGSLVTHETSGRWAVTIDVAPQQFNQRVTYLINGRAVEVPPSLGGSLVVLGDAEGVVGISTGVRRVWHREDEKFRIQSLRHFSADGERLHVVVLGAQEGQRGGRESHWELTFEQRPRVSPASPEESDRLLRTLPGRQGVLVDGEQVLSYRKGGTVMRRHTNTVWLPACDPAAPASWQHLDRRTGRETTIWTDESCVSATAPFVGSQVKHGVAVLNRLGAGSVRSVARYELATGVLTPLPIRGIVETPRALSDDGSSLLLRTFEHGLAVFDARTGALVHVPEGEPMSRVAPLAGFFSAAPPRALARR